MELNIEEINKDELNTYDICSVNDQNELTIQFNKLC